MSALKSLAGKKMSKKVKFMGEEVVIYKLNVSQVLAIQEEAKRLENSEDAEEGFSVLQKIIASAVEGGDELDESDFENFPMDELSKLSQEIMKYSGMDANQGK